MKKTLFLLIVLMFLFAGVSPAIAQGPGPSSGCKLITDKVSIEAIDPVSRKIKVPYMTCWEPPVGPSYTVSTWLSITSATKIRINSQVGSATFFDLFIGQPIKYTFYTDESGVDIAKYIIAFETLPIGVFLSPETQTGETIPGENITYELTLYNNTLQEDSFLLSYSGNSWPTALSISETPLMTQGSALTFTLSVAVPAEAPWLAIDLVTVTAESQSLPAMYTDSAQITTQVYASSPIGVFLSPETQIGEVIPGENITYELTLNNNTYKEDSFLLGYSGNSWPTALSVSETAMIPHGSSMTFTLSVAAPAEAPWLATDLVTVTAISKSMPGMYTDSAQITTQVYAPPQISISPTSLSSVQYPDEINTQPLTIQNGYGIPLTFSIRTGFDDTILRLYLDETAGSMTFIDSSGYMNHAFCSGSSCPIAGVPGIYQNAVQFDGLDDYIQHPELVNGQPEGTISLWFKVDSWNPGYAGMYFWSATKYLPFTGENWDGFNLGAHPGYSDNQIMFGIYTIDWNWAKSGITPNPGEWYHLAGTWGPEGLKIYVNGQLKGTNAYNGPAPTWLIYNLIGSSSWPGTNIDGVIDEVSIHLRTLNAEEIFNLYQGAIREPWLSINPSSSSVEADSSISIEVTFDAAGINPGIYNTWLTIMSNDPENSLVVVPIDLTVLDPDG